MAAIISQLAAKRARQRAGLLEPDVPIEKSVYVLPRFDPAFDPEKHNRYVRIRTARLVSIDQQRKRLERQTRYGGMLNTSLEV